MFLFGAENPNVPFHTFVSWFGDQKDYFYYQKRKKKKAVGFSILRTFQFSFYNFILCGPKLTTFLVSNLLLVPLPCDQSAENHVHNTLRILLHIYKNSDNGQ